MMPLRLTVLLALVLATSLAQAAGMTLRWMDNSANETAFHIERADLCTGPFTEIGTTAADVATYVDNTLTEGRTYCWRVAAANSAGKSAFSPTVQGQALVSLPAAPSNLVAQPFPDPFHPPPQVLHSLTVTKSGTGTGTVAGTGISCGSDCAHTYNHGFVTTLTATPAGGSTFSGWSGACTGTGPCVVTMNAVKTVTATFGLTMQPLTVALSGSGTGTVTGPGISCGSDCTESYPDGTNVTLTAAPAGGSTFSGWSGPCSGTGSCMVTMTAPRAVTATFTSGVPVAGTERLCTSLGTSCICGEPMNTNSHDGGSTSWPGGFINFDDSPSSTQCFPSGPNAENYCVSGHDTVTAASQAAFLPSGHSLSHVFHQFGSGVCHVGSNKDIVEAADFTYCMRSYRRNDAATHIPVDATEQQKILTIGGVEPPQGFITIQLSMDVGGTVHTRFDGNYWNAAPDFQFLGNMSNCVGNFCRFEACMDVSAAGEGRARFRMTVLPPGSGAVTIVNKPVGSVLRPAGVSVLGVPGGGDAMYGQNGFYITYNSHFITTRVRPENRSFWPGPACEVEGGCPP